MCGSLATRQTPRNSHSSVRVDASGCCGQSCAKGADQVRGASSRGGQLGPRVHLRSRHCSRRIVTTPAQHSERGAVSKSYRKLVPKRPTTIRPYRRRQRDRTQARTAISPEHALPVPSLRSARHNLDTLSRLVKVSIKLVDAHIVPALGPRLGRQSSLAEKHGPRLARASSSSQRTWSLSSAQS